MIDDDESIPDHYDRATGVDGLSNLLFFMIPIKQGGHFNIVAKFDLPERYSKEWEAINELTRINCPVRAIMPLNGNKESHGVVLYQHAAGQTHTGKVRTLKKLLKKQLMSSPENCNFALSKVFDTIRSFHLAEPGAARMAKQGKILQWKDYFHKINTQKESIISGAKIAWEDISWDEEKITIPLFNGNNKDLPNPLYHIDERLNEFAGRIMISRIHGDLNLTNVLVGLDSQYRPTDVFLVDLASSKNEAITSLDFAKMECAFWRTCFPEIMSGKIEVLPIGYTKSGTK